MSAICIGTTTSGEPCRKKAKLGNDYCPQHDPERKPRNPRPHVIISGTSAGSPRVDGKRAIGTKARATLRRKPSRPRRTLSPTLRLPRRDLRRGAWIDPHRADMTVGSLAAQWKIANPAKRSSSLARDETILRLHVLPVLEERRIGAVTPRDIQGLVSRWVAEGKAPKTVRRQYDVVRDLRLCGSGRLSVRTPCRNVKLPAVAKRDRHQLTPDDVARLATAVGKNTARWSISERFSGCVGGRWLGYELVVWTSSEERSPSRSKLFEARKVGQG